MNIAILGKKRHGKGTVARVLTEEYGFTQHDFADRLRDMMSILDPIVGTFPSVDEKNACVPWTYRDAVETEGYEAAKERYPEIVRLLQVFGSEIGRDMIGMDFWVQQWHAVYQARDYRSRDIVISDVRFLNEIFAVHDVSPLRRPAVFIRVNRPGYVHNADQDGHSSEQVPEMPWGIKAIEIEADSVEELTGKVHDVMTKFPQIQRKARTHE